MERDKIRELADGIMGESEQCANTVPAHANDLDWRSSVPDPNSTREIQLTRGYVALVDADAYDWLNRFTWHCKISKRNRYAEHSDWIGGKAKAVQMHRLLLGITDPKIQIDHIDHNGLNNQRSNLRICDNAQNQFNRESPARTNTSGATGVSWSKAKRNWRAVVQFRKKVHYLGGFTDKQQAIEACRKFKREHYGEFYSPTA